MLLNIGNYKEVASPFGLIQAILQSGAFVPAPNEAVAEGEVVVGVLSDEDKALLTARNLVANAFNEVAPAVRASDDPVERAIGVILRRWYEVLNTLVWETLSAKHAEHIIAFGAPSLFNIRAGYQVVLVAIDENLEAMLFNVFGKMMGMNTGMVGGEEGHDCDPPAGKTRIW